jgi:6-phosphogluconolactonase/glucosamine-6-phosphate isomerase/deaminase
LGYLSIVAARRVWVLASGTGKEQALRDSLEADAKTPLGRVLGLRNETTIFSDIALEKT